MFDRTRQMSATKATHQLTKQHNHDLVLKTIFEHERISREIHTALEEAHKWNIPNLICFSGNRNGMDDATGLKNCAEGLRKIVPLAEKHNVIIQMELLNTFTPA